MVILLEHAYAPRSVLNERGRDVIKYNEYLITNHQAHRSDQVQASLAAGEGIDRM
jgi:hypothetical protein